MESNFAFLAESWPLPKKNLYDDPNTTLAKLRLLILPQVDSLITGTASPHVNVGDVKNYTIPLPPIEEQQEIVRRLESLLDRETEAKALSELEEELDRLEKSILAKAFRGELNTNNPQDESALELLSRSLAEKHE